MIIAKAGLGATSQQVKNTVQGEVIGGDAVEGAMRALSRDKREAILDGAAEVFAARGYEGASMSMITAAAGVSKGTIYQHFEGKAALFGAAVARECERSLAPLFEDAGYGVDLPAALRDIGMRFVTLLVSEKCVAIERTVHAEAHRFPELAGAFYEAGPGRAIAMMARFLAARVAAGQLAADDPVFAAEQFFMLCQTRVVMRRRLNLALVAEGMERAVDEAVRVFLAAYGR
jgi:TetR/AcrR family transcriptional repressor of mexJK operon